jgi:hypothetical protein
VACGVAWDIVNVFLVFYCVTWPILLAMNCLAATHVAGASSQTNRHLNTECLILDRAVKYLPLVLAFFTLEEVRLTWSQICVCPAPPWTRQWRYSCDCPCHDGVQGQWRYLPLILNNGTTWDEQHCRYLLDKGWVGPREGLGVCEDFERTQCSLQPTAQSLQTAWRWYTDCLYIADVCCAKDVVQSRFLFIFTSHLR